MQCEGPSAREGEKKMNKFIQLIVFAVLLSLLLAGCASGEGGHALSGILQGIGQGLSGL